MTRVPRDHPVKPLRRGSKAWRDAEQRRELAQCGTCERYWDDGMVTGMTPVPSGRCPFEYYHGKPSPRQGNSAAPAGQVSLTAAERQALLEAVRIGLEDGSLEPWQRAAQSAAAKIRAM